MISSGKGHKYVFWTVSKMLKPPTPWSCTKGTEGIHCECFEMALNTIPRNMNRPCLNFVVARAKQAFYQLTQTAAPHPDGGQALKLPTDFVTGSQPDHSSIWLWKITHLWIIFHGYVKWPEVRCLRCFPKKYGFTFLIPVAVNVFSPRGPLAPNGSEKCGATGRTQSCLCWSMSVSCGWSWTWRMASLWSQQIRSWDEWILFIFLYRKWMRMWRMVVIMITTTDSFSSNTFFSRGKSISPVDTSAVNASFLCRNLPPGRSMATSTSSPRRCRDLPPDLPWKSCWSSDPTQRFWKRPQHHGMRKIKEMQRWLWFKMVKMPWKCEKPIIVTIPQFFGNLGHFVFMPRA